jgi:heme oxygenase
MPRVELPSVRAQLLAATSSVHEALHRDALLGRLLRSDMSLSEYVATLRVFHGFFGSVEAERCRMGCWQTFSLDAIIGALTADLGNHQTHTAQWRLETSLEVLGALYVAHGASFGRNVFRRNIEYALPAAPQAFLDLPGPARPWVELTDLLEVLGQTSESFEGLKTGAERAFALVSSLARAERRHLDPSS